MAIPTPKQTLRRFVEQAWNKRNRDAVHQYLPADFRHHMPGLEAPVTGPAAYQGLIDGFLAAFPDGHMRIDEVFAEGTRVCIAWTFTGTHQGQFQKFAATGRKVSVEGVGVAKVSRGKILEVRSMFDNAHFGAQLAGQ